MRARTIAGVEDANRKVDRSARAGAVAVGGAVEIQTALLALPLRNDPALIGLYRANAEALVEPDGFRAGRPPCWLDRSGGSLADHAVLALVGRGVAGSIHGADFRVVDYRLATLNPCQGAGDDRHRPACRRRSRGTAYPGGPPAMTRTEYVALHERLTNDRIYDERTAC